MKLSSDLIQLLRIISQWLDRIFRNQRQEQSQDEHDEMVDDPNAWFDDHFNADERVRQHEPDAGQARETGTDPD